MNDNSPKFIGLNEGSVMENVGPNENVMKVAATDKDSGTEWFNEIIKIN